MFRGTFRSALPSCHDPHRPQSIVLLVHQFNGLRCVLYGPYAGIDHDELEHMAAVLIEPMSPGMCDTYHNVASGHA